MGLLEDYENNAREAQRMAENSHCETDRAAWLRIAERWIQLLNDGKRREKLSGAP
jgi:hypothetical protein